MGDNPSEPIESLRPAKGFVLEKQNHTFIFQLAEGHDRDDVQVLVDRLVAMCEDENCVLDWLDSALVHWHLQLHNFM